VAGRRRTRTWPTRAGGTRRRARAASHRHAVRAPGAGGLLSIDAAPGCRDPRPWPGVRTADPHDPQRRPPDTAVVEPAAPGPHGCRLRPSPADAAYRLCVDVSAAPGQPTPPTRRVIIDASDRSPSSTATNGRYSGLWPVSLPRPLSSSTSANFAGPARELGVAGGQARPPACWQRSPPCSRERWWPVTARPGSGATSGGRRRAPSALPSELKHMLRDRPPGASSHRDQSLSGRHLGGPVSLCVSIMSLIRRVLGVDDVRRPREALSCHLLACPIKLAIHTLTSCLRALFLGSLRLVHTTHRPPALTICRARAPTPHRAPAGPQSSPWRPQRAPASLRCRPSGSARRR